MDRHKANCDIVTGYLGQVLDGWVRAGQALSEIQQTKSYQRSHPTFENFCQETFGLSRAHCYRLIDASAAAKVITSVDSEAEINQKQALEFSKLDEDREIADAYQKAKQAEKWSMAAVKSAVASVKGDNPLVVAGESRPVESKFGALMKAWEAATELDRAKFVEHIAKTYRFGSPKKAGKARKRMYSVRFLEFWVNFPEQRKTKKPESSDVFESFSLEDQISAVNMAAEFAKSPEGMSSYCPGPLPWLNQRRFEESPSAWQIGDNERNGRTAVQGTNDAFDELRQMGNGR